MFSTFKSLNKYFNCHTKGHLHCQVIALSISLSQEVELWEASCYGLADELDHLINIGTNVNKATSEYGCE